MAEPEKVLYNGIALPIIPEEYKSSHQYVSINDYGNEYALLLSDQPFTIASSEQYTQQASPYLGINDSGQSLHYVVYFFREGYNEWRYHYAYTVAHGDYAAFASNPVYANYDVYYYTGNEYPHAGSGIFLHGSLPYGGIIIRCPDSVTQGLFIGIACDSPEKSYIDFTCELSGNTSPQTRLIQYTSYTARLECAKDEAAGSLTITVASADDPDLTVSKKIAVIPRDWTYPDDDDPDGGGGGGGGGWDETSLVTGIDLHVYPETVVPGGHATVEVSVNGIGNYSQAFTARLSGHTSTETELFSAGFSCNVWIAEEETAEYVLVTVASVQDPTITATEMIYIDYSGTEDEGTTQEQLQRAFWKGFAAARAYFQEAKVSAAASIHIAREEAEPTTKAGKLRRSFWQGFVSALIVAAAETAPETVPEGVLISSDGYILTDCNGVYLIAAVDAEPDEPEKPDVPEEPDEPEEVATMYLYGTPSESGNIGLRVGDTVTYYDGAVLPPLPEWDKSKCQNCALEYYEPSNYYKLYLFARPAYVYDVLFNRPDRVSFAESKMDGTHNEIGGYVKLDVASMTWGEVLITDNATQNATASDVFWTNDNINYRQDYDDATLAGTLYLQRTDPIPVGEIVEYIDGIPIYEKEDS